MTPGIFGDEAQYWAWLCQVLVNFHRMNLRGKGRNALVFQEEVPEQFDDRPGPAEEAIANADAASLRQAVDNLEPLLREVVTLYYFAEFSIPVISKMLSLPPGTIKWRLHQARAAIREKIEIANRFSGGCIKHKGEGA